MTPDLIPTIVSSTVIAAFVSGVFLTAQTFINRKLRTPADENESMRLGNEFLRGLISDASKEREELRQTIAELRASDTTNRASIARLDALLNTKNERIHYLETLQRNMADKLSAGLQITLADILGRETEHALIEGAP